MSKFFRIRVYSEEALAAFAVDEAYGTVPTRSFGYVSAALTTLDANAPGPYRTAACRITNVHFRLNPTNAVTYDLYLYGSADGAVNTYQLESDKFFDSNEILANMADDIEYLREVDRVAWLDDPARIWYVIDWSAAPGDTTGYIEVCGERDA